MALFEAPGWDTGTTPIVNGPSGPSLSAKRSKRKRAESNDEASDTTTGSTTQVNLQKLMRKMRLEGYSKKNLATNGTPDSHQGTSKDDLKKRRSTTKMDPPDSPVSKTTRPLPPQSSSPLDQPISLPPSKKVRIQREESDILPPSSAGDEEDAGSVVSHIKTKRRSKKQRKLAAASATNAKRPADTSGALVDISDAGMETETDGNCNIAFNAGKLAHGRKAVEDDSSSGEFAGLTKLQREMKQKLSGGRFRYA